MFFVYCTTSCYNLSNKFIIVNNLNHFIQIAHLQQLCWIHINFVGEDKNVSILSGIRYSSENVLIIVKSDRQF